MLKPVENAGKSSPVLASSSRNRMVLLVALLLMIRVCENQLRTKTPSQLRHPARAASCFSG
jgi:hypothetical protein